jgi:hypothetical protein
VGTYAVRVDRSGTIGQTRIVRMASGRTDSLAIVLDTVATVP